MIQEKLIVIFVDDLEGCKTSVEDATVYMLKIAKEIKLDMEPKDETGLVPSCEKTLIDAVIPCTLR